MACVCTVTVPGVSRFRLYKYDALAYCNNNIAWTQSWILYSGSMVNKIHWITAWSYCILFPTEFFSVDFCLFCLTNLCWPSVVKSVVTCQLSMLSKSVVNTADVYAVHSRIYFGFSSTRKCLTVLWFR